LPRKKHQLLTEKEKRLLSNRLQGKSLRVSAIEAGYSPASAAQIATATLDRIEKKLPDVFARHGLDDDSYVSKHLIPLLSAEEERVFCSNGEIKYSKPVPALPIRARMMELLADIKGLRAKAQESSKQSVTVVVLNPAHRAPRNITPSE
jgi:hypothetical protein